jgi:AraC-like DNA-binding protein
LSHRVYKPAFPLTRYVDSIWRTTHAGTPSPRQRVYPNGAMALVLHLKQPTLSFFLDDERQSIRVPLLAGPYSRAFEIDPSESTAVIGVLFRPGAARTFFPVAAHELHNADIALSELNPSEAEQLLNDVCSASGEDEQLLAVEEYLRQKMRDGAAVHPAIDYVVECMSRDGGMRLGHIQQDIGLSHTRLNQLFREHVGVTPKLFCRIRRFRALLDRIEKGMPVNWAEAAADCGYFDQPHLIRDFRAFAGITPLEFSRTLSA